jgi:hypothetical protein
MEEETVTLPKPPEGYKYRLVRTDYKYEYDKDKNKESCRKYREQNKDKVKEQNKLYYERNKRQKSKNKRDYNMKLNKIWTVCRTKPQKTNFFYRQKFLRL